MNPVHVVALLAVLEFFVFTALVGQARVRYGVKAPAVSGHEQFERAYRVQMNTLEQLAIFLPALLIAGLYWPAAWVAGAGVVWLIGRLLYRHGYLRDPKARMPGFALTLLPSLVLLVAALTGAITGV